MNFKQVLNSIQQFLVVTDFAGEIQWVNEHSTRLFEPLEAAEIAGRDLGDLLGQEDLTDSVILKRLNTNGVAHNIELTLNKHDREPRYYVFSASMFSEANGEKRITYVGIDVTDIKKNYAELMSSANFASLGDLTSYLAHEIANPLAIIDGYATLLPKILNNGDFEKIREKLEKIKETSGRAKKIISNFRTFSRDSSKDPFERIKLSDVIHEAVDLCKSRFRDASEMKIDVIQSDLSLEFECRAVGITQVLVNLIGNALDAIESCETQLVTIECKQSNGQIKVTVSDSGPGVPEELRQKIMMPFFTTKVPGKGTGLGLSICKRIIESHHGKLFLEQGPQSRFSFVLPKYQVQPVIKAA